MTEISSTKAKDTKSDFIPVRFRLHFQLKELESLNLERALESCDGRVQRWLFRKYGAKRIKQYVREFGERDLCRMSFNSWRNRFRLKNWTRAPEGTVIPTRSALMIELGRQLGRLGI